MVQSLSSQGRDKGIGNTEEQTIKELVKIVCEVGDTELGRLAFAKLRGYVDSYIKLFARKYKIAGHDEDEIEQECLYALRYKAIEDFDPGRGKFKTFATLCIRRHLYSLIKGSNQQKRTVQNKALSLHDTWAKSDGDDLPLVNLVVEPDSSVVDKIEKQELLRLQKERLMERLSDLEKEVLHLYLQKYRYAEIVEKLKNKFPRKKMTKKVVDNSLVRCRQKAHSLRAGNSFFDM